jgi:hypothetical protein
MHSRPYRSIGWLRHHTLRPCVRCELKSGDQGLPSVFKETDGYYAHVTCEQCRYGGPNGDDEADAIKKWNEQQERRASTRCHDARVSAEART